MKKRLTILLALLFVLISFPVRPAEAKATDEILAYTIKVDVNQDASLNMLYHIEWKVLDDSIGALEWVRIGIPNSHYISCDPASSNISRIKMTSQSGEQYADVYFKDKYYEDQTVSFDFLLVQDFMYEMNTVKDGETVYYFIPGWFDGIAVDRLEIKWNADKATAWSHGATVSDGYIVWSGSLSAGSRFDEVSVTYPSDAFTFSIDRSRNSAEFNGGSDYYGGDYYNYGIDYYDDYNDTGDAIFGFVGLIFFIAIISIVVGAIKNAVGYNSGSGFTSTATTKKITRTLIKYYPTCPGCGANRPENAETCEYCGRSFIESEEVVEEKAIENPDKYKTEGTFRYGSSPNTFIRVHVTPVHIPVSTSRSHSSSSRGGGSHHSSCAHSSCACAHSCACACACACAGGGRAGCSTKDFYNTNLKLSQLKRRVKANK